MAENSSKDLLGPEIRKFLAKNIDSVAMLEVLLFLFKRKEAAWTAEQITHELRSSLPAVQLRLTRLIAFGLVRGAGSAFEFDASSDDIARTVEKLHSLHQQYPMRVIEQIYSRKSHAQILADAFRIKPGDEDG